MSVFRVEKNKNFTVMSNHHLQDRNLSLKAKGLLSLMLSLPDDWDYSLAGLERICQEAAGAINRGIQELERCGYIVRHQERDDKGRLGSIIYTIYEEPQEKTENKGSEPFVQNPQTDTPQTDNPHADIEPQVNTNKQSTYRQMTQEQNDTLVLTSRARDEEQLVDDLKQFIIERIGRSLWVSELRLCTNWVRNQENIEMIHLAVEDNLFRKDMFDLKYVERTIERWRSSGIDTPLKARNYILDRHVSNVTAMAAEIAERNHNDDLRDKIIFGNEMADLKGTRDYLIELYQQGRYDSLITLAQITYHKDILDYLPDEIRDFIQEHTA